MGELYEKVALGEVRVDRILEIPKKSTIYLLSPVVRGTKGE